MEILLEYSSIQEVIIIRSTSYTGLVHSQFCQLSKTLVYAVPGLGGAGQQPAPEVPEGPGLHRCGQNLHSNLQSTSPRMVGTKPVVYPVPCDAQYKAGSAMSRKPWNTPP